METKMLYWKSFPVMVCRYLQRLLNAFGLSSWNWYYFQLMVANKDNKSWYEYQNQSRLIGMSRSAVEKCAKLLHDLGLVSKRNQFKKEDSKEYSSNMYSIKPLPKTYGETLKFVMSFMKCYVRTINKTSREIRNKNPDKLPTWENKVRMLCSDIQYLNKLHEKELQKKQWFELSVLKGNLAFSEIKVTFSRSDKVDKMKLDKNKSNPPLVESLDSTLSNFPEGFNNKAGDSDSAVGSEIVKFAELITNVCEGLGVHCPRVDLHSTNSKVIKVNQEILRDYGRYYEHLKKLAQEYKLDFNDDFLVKKLKLALCGKKKFRSNYLARFDVRLLLRPKEQLPDEWKEFEQDSLYFHDDEEKEDAFLEWLCAMDDEDAGFTRDEAIMEEIERQERQEQLAQANRDEEYEEYCWEVIRQQENRELEKASLAEDAYRDRISGPKFIDDTEPERTRKI